MPPGLQHGFGEQAEGSVDGLVPLSGLEPMKVVANRRARRAAAKAAAAAVQPAASVLAVAARVVEFRRVRSQFEVLVAEAKVAGRLGQQAEAAVQAAAWDEREAALVAAAAVVAHAAAALEVAELEAELSWDRGHPAGSTENSGRHASSSSSS